MSSVPEREHNPLSFVPLREGGVLGWRESFFPNVGAGPASGVVTFQFNKHWGPHCAEHGVRQPLLISQMGSRVGNHEVPQASGTETDSCLDHDTHFLPMGSIHYATQGTHVPPASGIQYEDNI